MNTGDIVTLVTTSGEYVGKLSALNEDGSVQITDPRMILSNPETGQMGFAKGIAVTGEENPTDVIFQSIVFMTPTNEKVADAFRESTGSIKVPSQKIVS